MGSYNSKFDFEETGEDYYNEQDYYFQSSSYDLNNNSNISMNHKLTEFDVYKILTEIDICYPNKRIKYYT